VTGAGTRTGGCGRVPPANGRLAGDL